MPRKTWTNWTERDEEKLKDLVLEGLSVKEIVEAFNGKYTPSAVKLKKHRLGLKSLKPSQRARMGRQLEDLATQVKRVLRLPSGDNPSEKHKTFTDRELEPWRDNPEAFLRDVLSIKPLPYQAGLLDAWLRRREPRICVAWGRQTGKDFTLAAGAIYRAILHPGARILLVSNCERASKLLADRIIAFLARNRKLYQSIQVATTEKIAFTNGSEIIILPCSAETVRGFTHVSDLILNEAAHGPDQSLLNAILPSQAAIEQPVFVMSSTPLGKTGIFWEAWDSGAYLNLGPVATSQNPYVSKDFIESQRRIMPRDAFLAEYEAVFLSSQTSFFDEKSIAKCLAEYDYSLARDPAKQYFLGWDAGRIRDASVLLVLSRDSDGNLKVEYVKAFHEVPFPEQVAYLEMLSQVFHFEAICLEDTGLSMPLCDTLERRGYPVNRFKPTLAKKLEAYSELKKVLEEGRITLPRAETRLIDQLRMLGFKVLSSGNITIHHSSESIGDDYCDALALATVVAVESESPIGLIDGSALLGFDL